ARVALLDQEIMRHPERNCRHRLGNEGCHGVLYSLIDDQNVLRPHAVRAQGGYEKEMRRGTHCGRNLSPLQVRDSFYSHIGVAPQLSGGKLNVIDQEYFPYAHSRIARDNCSGGKNIESPGGHCLKCFVSVLKFNKLHAETFSLPVTDCVGKPQLPINRYSM